MFGDAKSRSHRPCVTEEAPTNVVTIDIDICRRNISDKVEVQTSKLSGHRAPGLPLAAASLKGTICSSSRHDTYLRGRLRIDPCLSQVNPA